MQNVSKSANWCAALSPQGTEGAARLVRIKLLAADHQLVNIVRASLVTVGLAICGRGKGPERLHHAPSLTMSPQNRINFKVVRDRSTMGSYFII